MTVRRSMGKKEIELMDEMKKRWICLFVENDIGVLARISGLFSSKSYNIDTLTVGVTEDQTMSRMTISLTSNDMIFEQIKKQLNRCVEVIKLIDYTNLPIHMKELMFAKVIKCTDKDKDEVFRIAQVFGVKIADYDKSTVLLECVQTEERNNELIRLLEKTFGYRIEIVRGGNVGIESISMSER